MPRITDEVPFGGALEKIARLGLSPLYDEVKAVIEGFPLLVKEEKNGVGLTRLTRYGIVPDATRPPGPPSP